ncbi:MAG: hypothetical protein ACI9SI_000697 [Polaribacter sp.]|jgi:hypothetical protein
MLYLEANPTNIFTPNTHSQLYLSVILEIIQIKANSKFIKTLFSTINFTNIETLTLEYNTRNEFIFHYLHFSKTQID